MLGALAPAATAAPAWVPAADVSAPGQDASEPHVAVDPDGDAVAVWSRNNGANDIVQATVRPAGGIFSAPVDLSAAGHDAREPQVAVDPAGNAVAVWQRFNGTNWIVQAAMRPAGGGWQPAVDVSAPGQNAVSPQVAIDSAGNATAVWQRFNGTRDIAQASTRPAGGAWQAPVDLSAPGWDAYDPQLAVDHAGNAVAVWDRSNKGANELVQAATRPAGGAWQPPVDLSVAGGSARYPQVAVDAAGNAVAVWERYDGTNWIVQAATRAAGGSFSAPVNLSTAGQNAYSPQVTLDTAGNAVAVWARSNGANTIVQAATRPAGGSFSSPVDLSAAGQDAREPQVADDAAGNVVAVWSRSNGADDIAQAAVRLAGGSFSAPVDLSAAGGGVDSAQVAVDPAGDAVAIWPRDNGANTIVQAAGYDVAGPQLRGLSVPAGGTVGVPVTFSVSPLDVWSPLGATTWSFGDGATGAGMSPTHTYARSGTFAVGLSSSDALGNASSASRTIAIAPAPRPRLSRLRLSPAVFRAARSGPSVKAAGARVGTRVGYSLDIAASVRFTVERARGGRRVGGRCVRPTRRNRTRTRCTRYVPVHGSFKRSRQAGADRFRFTGRLAGGALAPGRYRLVATPTANSKVGRPGRASFRIVR